MILAAVVLISTTLASVGLLSLWAAASAQHWFVRTAVFVGLIALTLLIPAYEPFVAFTIQGATVVVGVQLARWLDHRKGRSYSRGPTSGLLSPLGRGRVRGGADNTAQPSPNPFHEKGGEQLVRNPPRGGPRFSLRTILLATPLSAAYVAVASRLPALNFAAWRSVALIGLIAGLTTLLGAWLVYGTRQRWWIRSIRILPPVVGLALLLVLVDWFIGSFYSGMWPPEEDMWWATLDDGQIDWLQLSWLPAILAVACNIAVVLVLLAPWTRQSNGAKRSRYTSLNLTRATLVAMIVCTLIAPSSYVFYRLMTPLPIPEYELPDPNGYDDFVAAAQLLPINPIVDSVNYDRTTATLAQLQAAHVEILPALDTVRAGLAKQVWKPQVFESEDLLMQHIYWFRAIAMGFATAGALEEKLARPDTAADAYLDSIELSNSLARGGIVSDALIGDACAGIGLYALYQLRDALSVEESTHVAHRLQTFEQLRESSDEIMQRENIWYDNAMGWHTKISGLLWTFVGHSDSQESHLHSTRRRTLVVMRLLAVEFALRAWQAEHEAWPESLAELTPVFFPAPPVDPYSPAGEPLRYTRTEDGYLLYSVGQNGKDDDGQNPIEGEDIYFSNRGDLRLDVIFADE